MTPCAYGCTTTNQHTTDCPGNCRGCLPRPAEHGTLCAWCWQRLNLDLESIPALLHHLREIAKPTAQAAPLNDGTSRHGDPAEATVLPAAWLEADELENNIAGWAHVTIDTHPNALRGPNAAPWHGNVIAWLNIHLAWIATQDWCIEMRRELAAEPARLRARWPAPEDVERSRPVDVPCPRCNQLTLTYTPPTVARQPFVVACANPDCARIFNEDEWERFKSLALTTRRTA